MIARTLAIALSEFRIARRNRWVLLATLMLLLFALALGFAGSAPTGTLGVDALTVAVGSMTTLAVYLAPLLGLMMGFDGVSGESDRGSLALLLTYPLSRGELLVGKFMAQSAALGLAIAIGFGIAGGAIALAAGASTEGGLALSRLVATATVLGASFVGLGLLVSSLAGSSSGAAGLAALLWLVAVVLYDLVLLGGVVYDAGGGFTRSIFPWLLVLNPADAFRLVNLAGSEAVALATGMTGVAEALPAGAALASVLLWPVVALALARLALGRLQP